MNKTRIKCVIKDIKYLLMFVAFIMLFPYMVVGLVSIIFWRVV